VVHEDAASLEFDMLESNEDDFAVPIEEPRAPVFERKP
jgi:hypothetical protein